MLKSNQKDIECFNCGGHSQVAKFCNLPKISRAAKTQHCAVIVKEDDVYDEGDDNDVTDDSEIIVKTQRCVMLRNEKSVNESSLISKRYDMNENEDAWLTRIDPCCLSECALSRMTEDCVTKETDVSQCSVNAVAVKLAKLEHVSVTIGDSQLNCIVDSGSEITIVRKSKIPEDILVVNKHQQGKLAVLQSAFGNKVQADVMSLPFKLNNNAATIDIVCAVTNELVNHVDCSLTSEDYENLLENSRVMASAMLTMHDAALQAPTNKQQANNGPNVKLNENTNVKSYTQEMIELQHACPTLIESFKMAAEGKGNLFVHEYNKLLFHHEEVERATVNQLVLPECKRIQAMTMSHDSLWGGHLGAKKCIQRIRLSFWWPGMAKEMNTFCGRCTECQLRRRRTVHDNVPITPVIRPSNVFEIMNCDFIGPFEKKTTRSHNYVLVIVDQCSRWVECVPLRSTTAKATCAALLEIFARTGIPKVLISDNSTNFTASLTTEFRDRIGCTPRFFIPYHPEGNAIAERQNSVIKQMLHHVIRSDACN